MVAGDAGYTKAQHKRDSEDYWKFCDGEREREPGRKCMMCGEYHVYDVGSLCKYCREKSIPKNGKKSKQ